MIKLIKFSGDWIISQIEEVPDVAFGDPDCILKYPYQIEGKCMGPWPIYTDEREIVVRSSDINLVTDPSTFYLAQYVSLVKDETKETTDEIIEVLEEE